MACGKTLALIVSVWQLSTNVPVGKKAREGEHMAARLLSDRTSQQTREGVLVHTLGGMKGKKKGKKKRKKEKKRGGGWFFFPSSLLCPRLKFTKG